MKILVVKDGEIMWETRLDSGEHFPQFLSAIYVLGTVSISTCELV